MRRISLIAMAALLLLVSGTIASAEGEPGTPVRFYAEGKFDPLGPDNELWGSIELFGETDESFLSLSTLNGELVLFDEEDPKEGAEPEEVVYKVRATAPGGVEDQGDKEAPDFDRCEEGDLEDFKVGDQLIALKARYAILDMRLTTRNAESLDGTGELWWGEELVCEVFETKDGEKASETFRGERWTEILVELTGQHTAARLKMAGDFPNRPGEWNVKVDPEEAENPVGTEHQIGITVKDFFGNRLVGAYVSFDIPTIDDGAEIDSVNVGLANYEGDGLCEPNLDCTTDEGGKVRWTYLDENGPGDDEIHIAVFCEDKEGGFFECAGARAWKTWVEDPK